MAVAPCSPAPQTRHALGAAPRPCPPAPEPQERGRCDALQENRATALSGPAAARRPCRGRPGQCRDPGAPGSPLHRGPAPSSAISSVDVAWISGSVPSTSPTRKTASHSRPLAACSDASVTPSTVGHVLIRCPGGELLDKIGQGCGRTRAPAQNPRPAAAGRRGSASVPPGPRRPSVACPAPSVCKQHLANLLGQRRTLGR